MAECIGFSEGSMSVKMATGEESDFTCGPELLDNFDEFLFETVILKLENDKIVSIEKVDSAVDEESDTNM